ncbi:MAG: hypothetical protein P0S95_07555 [Rhabdochlamydiaceae bacterium]|nr:hypothetical protein [Candidatus Amphrikana amoebophyrae]
MIQLDSREFIAIINNDLSHGESLTKRVAVAALPILSLYRPVGNMLSLATNGTRVFFSAWKMDPSYENLFNLSL